MRSKYGDYFGITVAGYPGSNFTYLIVASSLLFLFYCAISFLANYKNVGIDNIMQLIKFPPAEAHPDVIQSNGVATLESYLNDLAYLKKKVSNSSLLNYFLTSKVML